MAEAPSSNLQLLRLMHLSSVSLPVGGYSFSQGLEYAVENGWAANAGQIKDWVTQQILGPIVHVDLPVMAMAWESADNTARLLQANDLNLACRETAELRLTDTAMGLALHRLLPTLGLPVAHLPREEWTFVCLFGWACRQWQISLDQAQLGFAWSWLENQIAAATKLVPLGQTQAQTLLHELQPLLPLAVERSQNVTPDQVGASLPGVAMASALHETQYSRLFRS